MTTLRGTTTSDVWFNALALFGRQGQRARFLIEGRVKAETNGLIIREGDETQPPATEGGDQFSSGAGYGIGPVVDRRAALDLSRLWVRNLTAGSNGTLVVTGTVVE